MPSTGLGSALRRKGPGCALDCLLDAPWLGPRLGLSLGLLLGLLWGQECAGAGLRGIEPGAFFGNVVGTTGKKIPNIVGFGTFSDVVEFPSLRAVSRIEAALQAPMRGALAAPCVGRAQTARWIASRTRLSLGRALDRLLDAPCWLAPWIALRWGRAWGLIWERRRFAQRERFLTLSGSELSLTLSGSLLCAGCLGCAFYRGPRRGRASLKSKFRRACRPQHLF